MQSVHDKIDQPPKINTDILQDMKQKDVFKNLVKTAENYLQQSQYKQYQRKPLVQAIIKRPTFDFGKLEKSGGKRQTSPLLHEEASMLDIFN